MKEKDDILETARERMREAREAEDPHIERAESDLLFATGEGQWPESERAAREAEGRPTLTFNAMPQYVRKVCGQIRGMNPAIKVAPSDNIASKDTAEIIEGLVREIEYRCDAQSVYEGAAESAVQCGIGHFRIRSDYCDAQSFDQHLLIERIFNSFAVFYDPMAKKPDRSDAEFVFIADEMRKDDFKRQFPKATVEDFKDVKVPIWWQDWRSGNMVTVAEYYWREYETITIYRMRSGQIIEGKQPDGLDYVAKREAKRPVVKWAKLSGHEVLEGPLVVPGEYIPVVAVTGEEIHIGETVYRSGAIRHAKDAQVTYNVMRTASVETTMLQPRAPFMVTAKQVAGLETFWNQANSALRPYLPYNVDDKAPPPSRVMPPVASQALTAEAQIAAEDMKRTIGIYDASLGARSNETSGVAIAQRQREGDMATSIYADNMAKAVAHAGRIIVGMIPHIYDAQRVVAILGEDAQEKLVVINEILPQITPVGVQYVTRNDLKRGKYAVRVAVGPSHSTKRQEAAEGMLEFMRVVPQAAPMVADLVAGVQEWPEADRIAERLRKALPPGMQEESEKEQPSPEQMQARQQQMQAQQEQMAMQRAAAEADIKKKIAEAHEAEADAVKARAEAQKAVAEVQMMQLRPSLPIVGPVAPMPPGLTG